MKINYIYNNEGIKEYAILPIELWESISKDLSISEEKTTETESFDPTKYFGCIGHLELDIESELLSMREEWNRNF